MKAGKYKEASQFMSVYQKLACEAGEQKAGRGREEGAAYCANKHSQAGMQRERAAATTGTARYRAYTVQDLGPWHHHFDAASGPGLPNPAGWVGALPSACSIPEQTSAVPVSGSSSRSDRRGADPCRRVRLKLKKFGWKRQRYASTFCDAPPKLLGIGYSGPSCPDQSTHRGSIGLVVSSPIGSAGFAVYYPVSCKIFDEWRLDLRTSQLMVAFFIAFASLSPLHALAEKAAAGSANAAAGMAANEGQGSFHPGCAGRYVHGAREHRKEVLDRRADHAREGRLLGAF